MSTQEKTITKQQLYLKGYTISAAARRIGCSAAHVNMVVNGKRTSRSLISRLQALPQRELVLRAKLQPAH